MAQYVPKELEELKEASLSSGSDEESITVAPWSAKRHKFLKTAAGVLCLLGACALALKTATSLAPLPGLRSSTSVRALLESQELADLATDNVMTVGGESLRHAVNRSQVHAAVERKLLNISNSLKEQHPEAHKKLELIQLSAAQKGQVFGVLRHFSDKRVIQLSNIVADAVKETARTNGDEAALKRRLMEKLSPRMHDIAQLGSELFPSRKSKGMSFNFDDTPVTNGFKKWHMKMEMSRPEAATPARRLSEAELSSGVTIQAKSMFDELGEMLGKEMPTEPARMLQEMQPTSPEHESLMECMTQNMGDMNVMGCVGCVFSNIQAVFAMVGKMLMDGMR